MILETKRSKGGIVDMDHATATIELCKILLMLNRVRLRKMEEQLGNFTAKEREDLRCRSAAAERFYLKKMSQMRQERNC